MPYLGKAFARFLLSVAFLIGAPTLAVALPPASATAAGPATTAPHLVPSTTTPTRRAVPAPVALLPRPRIVPSTPPPSVIPKRATASSISVPPMPSAIAALPPPEHGPMATGHNLIRHQIERMQTLVPTSGFATLEELGNAVSALGPPRAKVVELLKKETNFEFAMRAPEDIRDNIAKQGFLNQYDAKRSNGTFDPNARANVESSFLGMSREEYDKLPNTVRPKYGYLRPSATSGVRMADDAVGHYGSDIFVFKREAVRDYLTVYPNDSLGYSVHSWPVTPVAEEPSQWHHALLPWSTRMLLAPGLEVSDSGDLQFSQQTPAGFRNYPKRWGDRYLEIQIWRPLGLENVERFEFQSMPPSGDFLKALRQNGVKIFKKGDSEEWKGDLATPSQATIRMLRRPVVREALHTLLAEAA